MHTKRVLCLVSHINHRCYYLIWCVKFYILVKIRSHVGVVLGFVCYPLFSVFFCYPFPGGLCASLSPVRSFSSNKPSCRISVFLLAFQNVKIVKLLNVTKMKMLGMKFSGRTTISVAYYSLFQKETPRIGLPIFSRRQQPH